MLDEIDRRITASTGKRPLRYWSGMDRYQRKTSLETFKNTGGVMLAIKCLDEGVDIPAISHGIVLSSSKTKREWIQRRGRLLRKSSKKDKSVIYDVLAFPSGTGIECDFVMDEVKRAAEFSKSCLNRVRVEADLEMLMIEYDITETDVVLNPEDGSELDE